MSGGKVQSKVFLSGELASSLDAASRRTKRSKSEITQAALAAFLSPDGAEMSEAAIVRRLDRVGRELERIQRDVTISNEALAMLIKAWLTATPTLSAADQRVQNAKGQERYAGFLGALARRLAFERTLEEGAVQIGDAPFRRVSRLDVVGQDVDEPDSERERRAKGQARGPGDLPAAQRLACNREQRRPASEKRDQWKCLPSKPRSGRGHELCVAKSEAVATAGQAIGMR